MSEKQMVTTDPTCQVCGETLDESTVVLCRKCHTKHHRDCWRYNRGCAVFGCGCRTFEDAAALALQNESFSTSYPVIMGVKPRLAIVFVLMGLFTGLAKLGHLLPFQAMLPFILFFIAVGTGILMQRARYKLVFSPDDDYVKRQITVGRKVLSENGQWLKVSDIVEIHLHSIDDLDSGPDKTLYVAMRDGSRHLLQRMRNLGQTIAESDEIDITAERVAALADTTVRFISGEDAPSVEEIQQAAAEAELESAPQKALPES